MFEASETLTLARASKSSHQLRALALVTANTTRRVGRACVLPAEEVQRAMRCEGESPDRFRIVKQRPVPSVRNRGSVRMRVRIRVEGFTSRPEHCFGWFSPTLRRVSGG